MVYKPFSYSSPIDLLIDGGRGHRAVYYRVQVKSAHTRSSGCLRVHTDTHKYEQNSFDVFVAVMKTGCVWWNWWRDLHGKKTLNVHKHLRPVP